MMMKLISLGAAAIVFSTTSGIALAQSAGSAYFEDRLSQMARSVADLQGRIEQLRKQNQQLQQSLDKMRVSYESRLERLEKGAADKGPVSRPAAKPNR